MIFFKKKIENHKLFCCVKSISRILVRCLAAKPDDLSSISVTHLERTDSCRFVIGTHLTQTKISFKMQKKIELGINKYKV